MDYFLLELGFPRYPLVFGGYSTLDQLHAHVQMSLSITSGAMGIYFPHLSFGK